MILEWSFRNLTTIYFNFDTSFPWRNNMSNENKKQMLTESEVRRFMKLANLPPIGDGLIKEFFGRQEEAAPPVEETPPEPEMDAGMDVPPEAVGGEEDTLDLGDVGGEEDMGDVGGEVPGAEGGDKEAQFAEAISMLAGLLGIDVDFDAGAAGGVGDEAGEPVGDAPVGDDVADAGGEESEKTPASEDDTEEEEAGIGESAVSNLQESRIVELVLKRVAARLVAEAKKKKETASEKMKRIAKEKKEKKSKEDKKEVVKEANASAPKSSNSNASANGVAKGNGPGSTQWGTKKQPDQEWKDGVKNSKGGHELETVAAKNDHTVKKGGKNLSTLGGNKKK